MLIITLVLVSFGLVMMMSASTAYAYYQYGDSFYFVKDQLLFIILGVVLMLGVSRINYRVLRRFAWPLYGAGLVMLVLTLFMPSVGGAQRWIMFAGFQFQPSEIMKFSVILLFAHLISNNYTRMRAFSYGYVFFLLLLAPVAGIMIMQPHLSGTILICLIGVTLMFVGGTRVLWFGLTAATVIPAGLLFLKFSNKMEYAMARIDAWFDPFKYSSTSGYQTIQSLLAIGSGGLFGLGLGNSRQKHLYVPEPQNDFIFSIICEELGYVGALFVIGLFVYFIFRGFSIGFKSKDKFGALLAIGITAQIALQVMLNIGVVTNTIPNTGISLPFFSQGGTSMVILLMEVGVLLSVSRFSKVQKS